MVIPYSAQYFFFEGQWQKQLDHGVWQYYSRLEFYLSRIKRFLQWGKGKSYVYVEERRNECELFSFTKGMWLITSGGGPVKYRKWWPKNFGPSSNSGPKNLSTKWRDHVFSPTWKLCIVGYMIYPPLALPKPLAHKIMTPPPPPARNNLDNL